MAQTMDHLLQTQRYLNQRGMRADGGINYSQFPVQIGKEALVPFADVMKKAWSGPDIQRQFYSTLQDSVRFARSQRRFARSQRRSKRTLRTGLSYRQRQARGRAARVR